MAGLAIAILAAGCRQSNLAGETPAISDTNSMSATQQLQSAKNMATNVWQKTKEATTNAWASVKAGTTNAWVDIRESLQPAADYTYEKKDAFVAGAKADLDALDQKIKELSDKTATADGSVTNEAQTKLQDLRDKRTELGRKFDDMKNATQADWNDLKTGFETAYDDTKTSLKQAWQWLVNKLS